MAPQFQPPPDWLIQDYLTRKAPAQQASDTINQALQGYAQVKQAEHKQKNEALQTLLKAADSVDLSDPATAKAFDPLYKDAGVDPSIFQPPAKSTTTVAAPPLPTPTAGITQQGMDVPTLAAPAAPSAPLSPAIEASLQHPAHQPAFSPEYIDKMSRTGYGRKVIASREAGVKLSEAEQAKADKDAENAPVSFDYARAKGEAAGFKDVAEPFIKIATAEGRDKLSRKEMADIKDAITARTSGLRGTALDSMAATRQEALRNTLNQEATKTLNPLFQSGAGKDQVVRLNAIGRAEPLIQQMLNQPSGGDPRQMRELATSLNKVVTGSGMGAESQIEGLIPQTARGRFANWQEFLTNNPSGTEQQAFIKRFAETLTREKGAIQGQIRNMAEMNAPTLRVLKQHHPQDYQAHLDSVLNNAQLVGQPVPSPSGPKGPTVTQNGHTYTWNGTTYE